MASWPISFSPCCTSLVSDTWTAGTHQGGGADGDIAVPNGNNLDVSGRCLSAISPMSKRAIIHSDLQAVTHPSFNVLIITHERPIVVKDRCTHKNTSDKHLRGTRELESSPNTP